MGLGSGVEESHVMAEGVDAQDAGVFPDASARRLALRSCSRTTLSGQQVVADGAVWPHRVGALATAKKDAARANRVARLRDDLRGTMRQRNHCERKSMRRIGREGMLQDEEAEINRARLTSEPLEIRFVIVLDRLVDLCGHAFVAADFGGQYFSKRYLFALRPCLRLP